MIASLLAATLLAAMLGAAVASFAALAATRIPRGGSIVWPGSACAACGHPIRWYDNVPLVAWLALGGRCRDCGAAIPLVLFIIEAAGALAGEVLAHALLWPR